MASGKLGIFIITYNRVEFLNRTLNYLAVSPLRLYPITILDNASTDNTAVVASAMIRNLPNMVVISNKVNVGANANFLKAFEYSKHEYTWVICDDDTFDLSEINDVLEVLEEGKVNLIHVGAHTQKVWRMGGKYSTPKELLLEHYAYFKFSSFMPCNIFKTDKFNKEYLVKGYNNIGNSYPHMPFLLGIYSSNEKLYVAKRQIVFAHLGGQSYSYKEWYPWWMKTCELLIAPTEVKRAYLDQWRDDGVINNKQGLKSLLHAQQVVGAVDLFYVKGFISRYFGLLDKLKIKYYSTGISDIRDNLYWARVRFLRKINERL